ncbi:MAG: hypothetical protein H7276_06380, partial [Caulobacter sp.]|nr:hypothetical protein [Vitreoscilla sp.]
MPHRLLSLLAVLGPVASAMPAHAHDDDVRIHGVAVGTQKLRALPNGV